MTFLVEHIIHIIQCVCACVRVCVCVCVCVWVYLSIYLSAVHCRYLEYELFI